MSCSRLHTLYHDKESNLFPVSLDVQHYLLTCCTQSYVSHLVSVTLILGEGHSNQYEKVLLICIIMGIEDSAMDEVLGKKIWIILALLTRYLL